METAQILQTILGIFEQFWTFLDDWEVITGVSMLDITVTVFVVGCVYTFLFSFYGGGDDNND